jgi:formylglycine-generating enzyme required for sulfatase activity
VINVSWSDVTRLYLPWLSRKTGKAYRLLTDAEWEYAARATTTTRYAFGDTISPSQARFGANMTVPVGSFQPNAFGLYDMHGNVWEWVQDCWNESRIGAPSDGSAALTTGLCNRRVLRGGAWYLAARDLRSALRYWLTFDYRDNFLGFRVARAV